MVQVDDEDLRRVREFLSAEWANFVSYYGDEEEAQRIYEAIGGEPE